MTAGTTAKAPDGTEVVLGEIGTRVLLENPRVRVWEVALDPGEAQGWHLHHNPYVVLCLSTSPCHMDWLDGSPARQLSETVGGSVYRPVSPVHMLTNHGDAAYRNRLIEVLDLGEETSGTPYDVPAGVAVDSSFAEVGEVPAKVVVDEDDVRVQHVTPDAGESYTWQTGAYPALVVDLDLATEPLTGLVYLEPGESYTLPAKPTRTSGYNLVELRYFSR
ncbi:cupin domain-containing protein [Kribbella endophytica]